MTEASQVWTPMRSKCPLKLKRLTDRFDKGIPDVLYTGRNRVTGLIELKHVREGNVLGLDKAQALWIMEWVYAGGRAWVFAKHDPSDEYWLFEGKGTVEWAKEIVKPITDERQLLITRRWTGRMNWPELALVLTCVPL